MTFLTLGEIRHLIERAWVCQISSLDSIRGITHVAARDNKVVAWFNFPMPQLVHEPKEFIFEARALFLASQITLRTSAPYVVVIETLDHRVWAKVFKSREDFPLESEDQIKFETGWRVISNVGVANASAD